MNIQIANAFSHDDDAFVGCYEISSFYRNDFSEKLHLSFVFNKSLTQVWDFRVYNNLLYFFVSP